MARPAVHSNAGSWCELEGGGGASNTSLLFSRQPDVGATSPSIAPASVHIAAVSREHLLLVSEYARPHFVDRKVPVVVLTAEEHLSYVRAIPELSIPGVPGTGLTGQTFFFPVTSVQNGFAEETVVNQICLNYVSNPFLNNFRRPAMLLVGPALGV